MSNKPTAHYNSSKMCWEILVEEPQGDRMVLVHKEANTAHKMLKDQGIKFVDAHLNALMNGGPMLLIADYRYWIDNEQEILDWFSESNIKYAQTGMILEFESNEDKMMFLLRWL